MNCCVLKHKISLNVNFLRKQSLFSRLLHISSVQESVSCVYHEAKYSLVELVIHLQGTLETKSIAFGKIFLIFAHLIISKQASKLPRWSSANSQVILKYLCAQVNKEKTVSMDTKLIKAAHKELFAEHPYCVFYKHYKKTFNSFMQEQLLMARLLALNNQTNGKCTVSCLYCLRLYCLLTTFLFTFHRQRVGQSDAKPNNKEGGKEGSRYNGHIGSNRSDRVNTSKFFSNSRLGAADSYVQPCALFLTSMSAYSIFTFKDSNLHDWVTILLPLPTISSNHVMIGVACDRQSVVISYQNLASMYLVDWLIDIGNQSHIDLHLTMLLSKCLAFCEMLAKTNTTKDKVVVVPLLFPCARVLYKGNGNNRFFVQCIDSNVKDKYNLVLLAYLLQIELVHQDTVLLVNKKCPAFLAYHSVVEVVKPAKSNKRAKK